MDQKQPGQVIRELLDERGWTQLDLARVLGRPIPTVNEIIQGKRGIMPEMAVALSAALGHDAHFWMRLDANRQLAAAESSNDDVRRRAAIFDMVPVKDMEKRGWIKKTSSVDALEAELRQFFAAD